MTSSSAQEYRKSLAELFSGYRAEWINEEIFNLFSEPSYFPQLTSSHPCFLVGGRGSGKTTTLRCLSYQGQAQLQETSASDVSEWSYYGMYHRINTNRVRAFVGSELSESAWIRLFAHYINLEFCELVLRFLRWYRHSHQNSETLGSLALASVSTTLHLNPAIDVDDLASQLNVLKLRFEAYINNVADASNRPQLSLQGAPIDVLMDEVKKLPQFSNKSFFFLVDEYENLNRYQQRVVNTLIKHCGNSYSFKIGVRELGFRERSTLNDMEKLTHPADYKLIDIAQELSSRFSDFAGEVCKRRLVRVIGDEADSPDPREMLPELLPEEEAEMLGVSKLVAASAEALGSNATHGPRFQSWIEKATSLEFYSLITRATAEQKTLEDKLLEALREPSRWHDQYQNYKHSYLFAIRPGKRGIRKYFAGWRVYCLMAGANIRFLLEMVDQALNLHLDGEHDLLLDPISFEDQTLAAQETGRKNLRELEGLSLGGAKLTRLLLGLGRVFQIMAEQPIGHTPEVNQFHMAANVAEVEARRHVEEMLTDGVMHLALTRYSASKLQQDTDIRQYDYAIHPIFSAFFGYSHRRKRKIELTDKDFRDLVDRPADAIGSIIKRQNRVIEQALPEQLRLFADYYDA